MLRVIRKIDLIVIVAILGCGGDDSVVSADNVPEVRLVDDGSNDFHFQWDEPLKEERIIPIRCHFEGVAQGRNGELHPYAHSWTKLIYFPSDSFVSKPLRESSLVSIKILSSQERAKFSLPTRVYMNDEWYDYHDSWLRILKEHPFKPYRVGKPSNLTFEMREPEPQPELRSIE